MNRSIKESLSRRRSYYSLSDGSPVSDKEIEDVLKFAAKYIPSAFNSQATRMVLLLGANHKELWKIVKSEMRKILPDEVYDYTEAKIEKSFASGYGTVLFYEDQAVVAGLQEMFPLYSDNFPIWSEQASAMHQLTVWTMLEDLGFGASLQHYNPIIDDAVRKEWNLPETWKMIAQMPFGMPLREPDAREHNPVEDSVFVFK